MLRPEFPDVTISKIRFLESQGLIEPERTASGYRKFYEADIARLRWILQQQKDKYLPLRVIRGKLDEEGALTSPAAAAALAIAPEPKAVSPEPRPVPLLRDAKSVAVADVIRHPSAPPRTVSRSAIATTEVASDREADRGGYASSPRDAHRVSAALAGVSMTLDELVRASGLSTGDIAQLEDLGLVKGRGMFSETFYDEDALLACRLTAGFLRHGVETRHLRMYKMAADREASFFEQIVTPLLRRKDGSSRAAAVELLNELGHLGDQMHALALRQALQRTVEASPPRVR